MTKEELYAKIRELTLTFEASKLAVYVEYVRLNSPYAVGDIFTDHIGTIRVEEISVSPYGIGFIYYGSELKKDGTPKKNGRKRRVFLSN